MKKLLIGLIIILLMTSLIIRHDVPMSKYAALANESQFQSAGYVSEEGKMGCSCVLIDKQYVLTAAHCFFEAKRIKEKTFDLNDSTKVTAYQPFGKVKKLAKNMQVHIGNEIAQVIEIIEFPKYKGNKDGFDIGLLKLAKPITSVIPITLNKAFDELNTKVVGIGFGSSGVANQMETIKKSGKKLAGENIIDQLGGKKYKGISTELRLDFDHPDDATLNKMGDNKPLPLEFGCAGGDSGSPLYAEKNGQWKLIGICSGGDHGLEATAKNGYYGMEMRYARVSAFHAWITKQINQ